MLNKSILVLALSFLMINSGDVQAHSKKRTYGNNNSDNGGYYKPSECKFNCKGFLTACNDGLDNDGDGKKDYPADPGCSSSFDDDEKDYVKPDYGNKCTHKCNSSCKHKCPYKCDDITPQVDPTPTPTRTPSATPTRTSTPVCTPPKYNTPKPTPVCTPPSYNTPKPTPVCTPPSYNTPKPTPMTFFTPTPEPTRPPVPDCTDKNIADALFAIDSGAKLQLSTIKKSLRQLVIYNPKEKVFADKTLQRATELYQNAWVTTWSVPQVIRECTNDAQCAKADYTSNIESYNSYAHDLKNLVTKISKKLVKIKNNPQAAKAAVDLMGKASAQYDANTGNSAIIPLTDDRC